MKILLPNGFFPQFMLIVLSVLVLQWVQVAHADKSPLVPPEFAQNFDVSEALVGFVSFATTPGVQSANYKISWPDDQPEVDAELTSLELEFDIDLRTRYFKLFTGIGFSHIYWNDTFETQNTDGDTIIGEPDRDLYAARLSGGLTFQVTPHLRATPYLSFVLSWFESETTLIGPADLETTDPALKLLIEDFDTKATTLAGTFELKYDRWFDRRRIEVWGRYTYSYTDTFDESADFLKSSGDLNVLDFEGRWTAPTGLRVFRVPLRWKLIGGYTRLLDLDKESLGFRYFFEYGGGLDLAVDVRPFGLFNLRNLGLTLTGVTGDDITGWSFGISLSN